MATTIGSVTSDQAQEVLVAMGGPFFFDIAAEHLDEEVDDFRRGFEFDRMRCAFDDGAIVGTLGAHSFAMTVPGSAIACAGTTIVTVQPTHRRSGILRRLIEAHFEDARNREEPMAALYASDSAIYGRFGYGSATTMASVEVAREHVEWHRLASDPQRVRAVPPAAVGEFAAPIFESAARQRPGMFPRSEEWWRRFTIDRDRDRSGRTAFRYAVFGTTGYLKYSIKEGSWSGKHGDHVMQIHELIGLDPAARSALWHFALNLDLVTTITAANLPVDSALFDLLRAPRRASPRIHDAVWVRLLDVATALEQRTYSADGRFSFTVHDPMDDTTSSFALDVDAGHGTCRPTSEGAIELDIEDLGACFLGRSRFSALGRSGRVSGDPESLRRADLAFGWDPAPWCQQIF